MKYAWVENGAVRDVCPGIPSEHYTPQVAALYTTEVEDHIHAGATFVMDKWTNPIPLGAAPLEPPVLPRLWTANDVRSAMSLLERVKWDNDQSGMIVTAKLEMVSAQTAEMIAPILQMLVDSGDITQETMNKVLA